MSRGAAVALLAANVLYCVVAVFDERLPGWKMFESVERLDYSLVDRDGVAIEPKDHLPRNAHVVELAELARVVSFVCERNAARAPFVFEERTRGVRAVLGPADCAVHARK